VNAWHLLLLQELIEVGDFTCRSRRSSPWSLSRWPYSSALPPRRSRRTCSVIWMRPPSNTGSTRSSTAEYPAGDRGHPRSPANSPVTYGLLPLTAEHVVPTPLRALIRTWHLLGAAPPWGTSLGQHLLGHLLGAVQEVGGTYSGAGSLRHRRSPSGCCLPRKEARRRPATHGRFRGCTSSGPSPRSPWLRTPGHPDARKVRYRPAGGLWPGKTSGERETRPTGTYRGTVTSFMLLRQSPRLRLRVAQSFACLGPG